MTIRFEKCRWLARGALVAAVAVARVGNAQEVDRIGKRVLLRRRQANVLKQSLSLPSVGLVRLASEFFAIKSKEATRLRREVRVVVGRELDTRSGQSWTKWGQAICAETT